MLSDPLSPEELLKYEQSGEWQLEEKYDGERIQILLSSDFSVRAYGRSLKEFTVQIPEIIQELAAKLECTEFHFDGEIVSLNPNLTLEENFIKGAGRMRLKSPTPQQVVDSPLTYVIFDMLNFGGSSLEKVSLVGRRKMARDLLKDCGIDKNKVFVNPEWTDNFQQRYEDFVKKGREGVMIKKRDSSYEEKRSKNWRKVVPNPTLDVKVIGTTEGQGKFAPYFGAFKCELPDGTTFKAGPGKLTMAEMKKVKEGISSGALKFPFVISVTVKGWMPSGQPRMARTERIRYDKLPSELPHQLKTPTSEDYQKTAKCESKQRTLGEW